MGRTGGAIFGFISHYKTERRGLGQIGAVTEEVDAHAAAVVGGMARRVVFDRAVALGLPRDESADAIVEGYAADYL